MINITFNNRKYCRTYINGSKKNELKLFKLIQGVNEDNSDCNWFEYRRMLLTYINDILHIIVSWRILINNISVIALIFIILSLKIQLISLTLIGLTLILRITYHYLTYIEKRRINEYSMCMSIMLFQIKKLSGLNLS